MIEGNFKTPIVNVDEAVKILSSGGLVALPTETVYGLAAIATQPDAILKIFKAKGRPVDHPLIVHVASLDEVYIWAKEVPKEAVILANKFWPGPLTMVFKKADFVSTYLTGGQDTVAIRIPNHQLTLEILRKLGTGVAAPSANRFGRVSPTLPKHVLDELDGLIDGVVDGGQCNVGLESTIVDLTSDVVRLLRPGHINKEDLELCLCKEISVNKIEAPRVPGSLKAHYAPSTPLKMVATNNLNLEIEKHIKDGIQFNLWSFEKPLNKNSFINWKKASIDPQVYAYELYDQLRRFDENKSTITLIEIPPTDNEAWIGVIDRLTRAQAHFK